MFAMKSIQVEKIRFVQMIENWRAVISVGKQWNDLRFQIMDDVLSLLSVLNGEETKGKTLEETFLRRNFQEFFVRLRE